MAVATWDLDRRHRAAAMSATDVALRLPAFRPALDGPCGGSAVGRVVVPPRVRRRVAGLALLLLVVGLGAAVVPRGGLVAATARPAPAPAVLPAAAAAAQEPWEPTVVIGPGETVWELAAPHAPAGTDLHVYVAEALQRNGLEATAIPPGTVIRLPR